MKVLFIAPIPPPITGNSLAAKVLFDDLVKYHDIHLINLSKNSFKQGINSSNRIISIFRVLKRVFLYSKNVDSIYLTISQSIPGNIRDILIYIICYNKLNKLVIHLHGGGIKKVIFDKNKILKFLNKYFFKRIKAVIVLGQSHIDVFSGMIKNEKIQIVPNFAESILFTDKKSIRIKFNSDQHLRLLYMSNLIPGKGYEELLNAFLSLDEKTKKMVSIDFAGDFESLKDKKSFIKKIENLKQVKYHGVVRNKHKKKLFANSHILCLPTYYRYLEGQPISILEAYASGCVVISTDHGGIRDVFKDKINGFEVEKKSSSSIQGIITKHIKNIEELTPIALSNFEIAQRRYNIDQYLINMKKIIEKSI
tara:strand:- start:5636 stop:6730 length:1095 start_codon:yes stop_codon:yes gene_type:complete